MRSEIGHFFTRGHETGLFLDYDGTLADIVSIPSDARPHAGTSEALQVAAQRLKIVAIISGRKASQLVEWLGPDVEIWGLHGAERAQGGEVRLAPEVESFVDLMSRVRAEIEPLLTEPGHQSVAIEDKRAILALHYRNTPDPFSARSMLLALAHEIAARHDLVVEEGRKVIELRPPVRLSKADVVLRRAHEAQLAAAAFAGDDLVDLPAFDALDRLAAGGVSTLRIAVASDETPRALIERADVVVEGPAGMRALLHEIARAEES